MSEFELFQGDCNEVMADFDDDTFDAVVCDPPYSLTFMGNSWDKHTNFQEWCKQWATEALRVLKPGGYLLAMGSPRTYHRLTCGIEDAGFEIRDSLLYLYGSGFPKSHSISLAIDKAKGGKDRGKAVATASTKLPYQGGQYGQQSEEKLPSGQQLPAYEPQSNEAKQWEGWGTNLKPAYEPIVMARKPLGEKTIAANVLKYGAGALNIDATRIGTEIVPINKLEKWSGFGQEKKPNYTPTVSQGRWPANLFLDEVAAKELDEQVGETGNQWKKNYGEQYANEERQYGGGTFGGGGYKGNSTYTDSGGPSRFFYTQKAKKSEKTEGAHPTQKPIDLMRYLVRLITPPGGIILDPFAGSGTTGIAAIKEGFDFVGIEQDESYCDIARRRIEKAKL